MHAAASSYDEEQEQLRRQLEGDTGDIRIEIPKEPEVNPEVYRDVEPLLFRGFLTLPAEIGGVSFVFKSLNQHEFELLRFMGGVNAEGNVTPKFWNTFLAYGVFLVDGQNVLSDRDHAIPKIATMFSDLPPTARQRVIRHLSEINRRASNAILLTEPYYMESTSRFRWAQLRGLDLTSPSVTGIRGSEAIGLNWAQLLWRALNYFDDRTETMEREWENAKFIGSCFAGKGLSKIYHQDNERRKKDKEERIARKDKTLRQVLLGEKFDDKIATLNGATLVTARSVEDLATQLEKDLKGEKDWHDKVIEEHENRIRTNLQSRRDQLQQRIQESASEFGGKSVVGGDESSSLEGLSPGEVQERIERRKQLEAQAVARQMVYPELDPKASEFLERHNMAPTNVPLTTRDPSGAVPIQPPREAGKPFRRA